MPALPSLVEDFFLSPDICSGTTEGDLRLGVLSSYSSSRADVLDFPCPGARWGAVSGLTLNRVVLHHHAGRRSCCRRTAGRVIQGWCGTCRHFADIRPTGTPPELGYGASRDDLKQRDPRATKKKGMRAAFNLLHADDPDGTGNSGLPNAVDQEKTEVP